MADRAMLVGVALALAAALLFGLVNVAAKSATLHPLALAGGTYLLAGAALAPFLLKARVARGDWPRVAAMALVGGALAPTALFYGLERTTALNASLLLTTEMLFTALFARVFLRESLPPSGRAGVGLLFAGAVLVGLATVRAASGEAAERSLLGDALVALAALAWGADNTLSADLARRHAPHHLVALKGLLGGAGVLAVALALRAPVAWTWPNARAVLFIGLLGIGASVVLFYAALQRIGATRTSALFLPTTALAGAAAAALRLREPFGPLHAIAAALILAGILALGAASAAEASEAGGSATAPPIEAAARKR